MDFTGKIVMFGGLGLPAGWLACDGASVSRSTYPDLFASLCITVYTGDTTNGSPIVGNISSTQVMEVGQFVSGTGIPAGAKIASIDASYRITLTANCTATGNTPLCVSPYGIGDGSTTFNVPDLRGRSPIGIGTGSGLTERKLGIGGGEECHTLGTAEMPAHSHSYTGVGTGASYGVGGSNAGPAYVGFTTGIAGSGAAHNNMGPYLPLKFIVKA